MLERLAIADGFELKYRVCEPVSGSVAIAVASDIGKVWADQGFGIQFEVTAVEAMLNLQRCGLRLAAAAE